jgi:hypothetical protein
MYTYPLLETSNMTNENNVTLGVEEIDVIRNALLIGLSAFGQVEEARAAFKSFESAGLDMTNLRGLCPRYPSGTSDVVSQFANALQMLGA